jgi:radical SAM protein with 4Fe4S-binding SPASM domain
MQPKCDVKWDKKSFEILKKTMRSISVPKRERGTNSRFATDLPENVGVKLTNRCNLRCKHCYQWNDTGYHRKLAKDIQKQDIDLGIMAKILNSTRKTKSRLYLWGGEPLCHHEFDQIADLLVNDPREVAVCTNGILIDRNLNSIIKISPNLELLIGIEGFEPEHDAIRGEGNFRKTLDNIKLLLDLREKGEFRGKISIHTVVNDGMIGKLYNLLEFYEQIDIDMVLLCFPWYLSEATSKKMDEYVSEKFNWLIDMGGGKKSWHAFKYRLAQANIEPLLREIEKINERVWKIRIRYQPGLEFDEITDFVSGNERPGQRMTKCLAVSTRMDVTPEGKVIACKHFDEFMLGDLNQQDLKEIWNCAAYERVRETIDEGLMPVCSKCNALYLHSI